MVISSSGLTASFATTVSSIPTPKGVKDTLAKQDKCLRRLMGDKYQDYMNTNFIPKPKRKPFKRTVPIPPIPVNLITEDHHYLA